MLKVFLDDSGIGQPPAFVLGGYVAQADNWEVFSAKWLDHCHSDPPVRYLKMSEAMALEGPFKNWPEDTRDKKLRGFQDLINRSLDYAVASFVSVESYREVFRNDISATYDNEYFFSVQILIDRILQFELGRRPEERISFVFDKQGKTIEHEIRLAWRNLLANPRTPEFVKRQLGDEPLWADEQKVVGLQCADMLAWTHRRITEDLVSPYGNKQQYFPLNSILSGFPNAASFDPDGPLWEKALLAERCQSKSWRPWMEIKLKLLPVICDDEELNTAFQHIRSSFPSSWTYEDKRSRVRRQKNEAKFNSEPKSFWRL